MPVIGGVELLRITGRFHRVTPEGILAVMYLVLLAAAVIIVYLAARDRELFCLSVRDGRVLIVRGRIPAGLLSDIRDVIKRPTVARATIRGVKQEEGARLAVSGTIDEGRAQRLRNIFHLYPISQLRAAPAIARPTLGQMLGIAWLAWLLERR
jgi:hypothetical protein